MSEEESVPLLKGPPEVLEAIDRFLADPSSGVPGKRPRRKVTGARQSPDGSWSAVYDDEALAQAYEEAELEDAESEEEAFLQRHWLLLTGLGIVALGLVVRWWWRRR